MSVKCYCEKKSTSVRKLQLKLKRKQQLQLICGFVACLNVLIYGVILKSHNIPNIPEIF